MDIYTATETAFKNGYEQGQKDTISKIVELLIEEYSVHTEDGICIICVDEVDLKQIAEKICD